MNIYKIIIYIFIGSVIFQSCRKGEDDPFISLRSRTNRLTGRWNLVKLNGYVNFYDDENTKLFWCQSLFNPELFNSMRYSKTSFSTDYYGYYYAFDNFSSYIKFDKNNQTYIKTTCNSRSSITKGSWSWNSDLGRNKEYIYISDLNIFMKDFVYYASGLSHFLSMPVRFEDFKNVNVFKIKKLSTKQLELIVSDKIEENQSLDFPKVTLIYILNFEKKEN